MRLPIELCMIGLDRMGTNMARRLLRAGHKCVVYDIRSPAVQAIVNGKEAGRRQLAAG